MDSGPWHCAYADEQELVVAIRGGRGEAADSVNHPGSPIARLTGLPREDFVTAVVQANLRSRVVTESGRWLSEVGS